MTLILASNARSISAERYKAELEGIIGSVAEQIEQAASDGRFSVLVKCELSRRSTITRLILDKLRNAGYCIEVSSPIGDDKVSILIEW